MLDKESARSFCLLSELTSTPNNETETQTWGAIDPDRYRLCLSNSMRVISSAVLDQGSTARDQSRFERA